jgi:hypothetical protein
MKRIFHVAVAISLVGLWGACERKGGPLRIDNVDPDRGSVAGGEQVTIHGGGFEPGKTQVEVRFGRRKSEYVAIASATKITAVTPPGDRGPVDVTLMFDNGTPFKIAGGFTYVAPAGTDDVRKAFFGGQGAPGGQAPSPAAPPAAAAPK